MQIAITGASGLIGSALRDALRADGVGIVGGAAHQGADGVAVGPEGVTERRADQSAGAGDGDLH